MATPFPINVPVATALKPNTVGKITGIIGEGIAASYSEDNGWMGSMTAFIAGSGYWLTAEQEVELAQKIESGEKGPSIFIPLLINFFITGFKNFISSMPIVPFSPA